MPNVPSARIHPTAVISPEADLADGVQVGAHVVIEGPVRVGPGCVLRPHAVLCGPLVLGRGNLVCSGAVLGERPQHTKYNDEPTGVEIGDDNIIREGVTIHRGTTASWTTRVGSGNFLMVNSHVAHDCQVGNQCILANGALLGGHCVLADNVFLSGNSAVHQFVRVGRLVLLSGCSTTTMDIPPFMIQEGRNRVVGVNVIGMRRAGLSADQIQSVRRAFQVIYRENKLLPVATAQVERELGHVNVIAELLTFIRESNRGINRGRESA